VAARKRLRWSASADRLAAGYDCRARVPPALSGTNERRGVRPPPGRGDGPGLWRGDPPPTIRKPRLQRLLNGGRNGPGSRRRARARDGPVTNPGVLRAGPAWADPRGALADAADARRDAPGHPCLAVLDPC